MGFFPGWYRNKAHRLRVTLEESAEDEKIRFLQICVRN